MPALRPHARQLNRLTDRLTHLVARKLHAAEVVALDEEFAARRHARHDEWMDGGGEEAQLEFLVWDLRAAVSRRLVFAGKEDRRGTAPELGCGALTRVSFEAAQEGGA